MNNKQSGAARIILSKTIPKYSDDLVCYDRFLRKIRRARIITAVEKSEVIATSDPIFFRNLRRWNRLFRLLRNRNAILHFLLFLNESYTDLCGRVNEFLEEVREEFRNSRLLSEFATQF
jgi:hypothetical protein